MEPKCPKCENTNLHCKDIKREGASCLWNLLFCSDCGHIINEHPIAILQKDVTVYTSLKETVENSQKNQKTVPLPKKFYEEEDKPKQNIVEPQKITEKVQPSKQKTERSRVTLLSTQELKNETITGSSIEQIDKKFSPYKSGKNNFYDKNDIEDVAFLSSDNGNDDEETGDITGEEITTEEKGKLVYSISFSKNKSPLFQLVKERIIRPLSGGGMAETYLYQSDFEGHEVVVIKIVKASDQFFDRFKREVKVHSALQHRNIIKTLEAGIRQNFVYLITEYADGGDLQTLMAKKGKISIRTSLVICMSIANALNYGWKEKGVIHRDVKPGNILLDKSKKIVKLSDFGLAKFVDEVVEETKITHTGISLGTPCYCSPEQIDKFRDATYLSDIYSLGAVLYNMIMGYPPYSEELKQHSISYFFGRKLQPEKLDFTDIPAGLRNIICTCMQHKPESRYQDYEELLEDLKNFYTLS